MFLNNWQSYREHFKKIAVLQAFNRPLTLYECLNTAAHGKVRLQFAIADQIQYHQIKDCIRSANLN